MALDRPRRWILRDEALVDIARRLPDNLAALGRIRGVEERMLAKAGEAILDAVGRGLAVPKDEWPREKMPPPLTPLQDAAVDVLAVVVRVLADANSITPAAVASRADLARLVAGRDSVLDHGWRRALVGAALREVLAGERALRIRGGQAVLEPCAG